MAYHITLLIFVYRQRVTCDVRVRRDAQEARRQRPDRFNPVDPGGNAAEHRKKETNVGAFFILYTGNQSSLLDRLQKVLLSHERRARTVSRIRVHVQGAHFYIPRKFNYNKLNGSLEASTVKSFQFAVANSIRLESYQYFNILYYLRRSLDGNFSFKPVLMYYKSHILKGLTPLPPLVLFDVT